MKYNRFQRFRGFYAAWIILAVVGLVAGAFFELIVVTIVCFVTSSVILVSMSLFPRCPGCRNKLGSLYLSAIFQNRPYTSSPVPYCPYCGKELEPRGGQTD